MSGLGGHGLSRDLFNVAEVKDLGWYMILGHWDGQHCPFCGSETWLPLGDDKTRCLSCRVEWESAQ